MKPFFSAWVLEPSQDHSGAENNPPEQTITIVPAGDKVEFHLRWRLPGESMQRGAFAAIPDGEKREISPGKDIMCSAPSPNELVTELSHNGAVIHHTHRIVHNRTMTVTEQGVEHPMTVSVYRRSPIKQVIVYRRDLKMRKGKIAAQVAHAAMRVFFQRGAASGTQLQIPLTPAMSLWVQGRFTKVVLSVESEAELLTIHQAARERGVPTALITDSGRTEFGGVPTRTTVAIGPAPAAMIDPITGRDGLVATKLA